MLEMQRELGLNREKLSYLALLLGSDYTEGINGIGIVNAIETINAFSTMEELATFRKWVHGEIDTESMTPVQKEFAHKHRGVRKNWRVSEGFPSPVVLEAYLKPTVDMSEERFTWGRPNLAGLRKFCTEKLDYTESKVEEVLKPVMKAFDTRTTQARMDSYVTAERAAVIQSARIAKAVTSLRKGKALSSDMAKHAAEIYAEEEGNDVKPRPKKKQRKVKAKPPANGPKRVKTAYFLFLDEFREAYREDYPNAKVTEIGSAAGARWKVMTEKEKFIYVDEAARLKAEVVEAQVRADKTSPDLTTGTDDNRNKPMDEMEKDEDDDDDFVPRMARRWEENAARQAKLSTSSQMLAEAKEDDDGDTPPEAGSAMGGAGCEDWRQPSGSKRRKKKATPRKRGVVTLTDSESE